MKCGVTNRRFLIETLLPTPKTPNHLGFPVPRHVGGNRADRISEQEQEYAKTS